jgi:hypothetical protein
MQRERKSKVARDKKAAGVTLEEAQLMRRLEGRDVLPVARATPESNVRTMTAAAPSLIKRRD